MSIISVVSVIPVRCSSNKNIITCIRENVFQQLDTLSEQLEQEVKESIDENKLQINEIYAVKQHDKPWRRAMVKFIRTDGVPVLQLLDVKGLLNFNSSNMNARKITKSSLRDLEFGEMKMFIHAIGPFETDAEYELIFNQILKDKVVKAIITLMEPKENRIHECFVGDLIYTFKGRHFSFRELLIKERISYPSRPKGLVNRLIFRKRSEWMAIGNGSTSLLSIKLDGKDGDPIEIVAGRFNMYEILGEGSVSNSYFS